jgi:transposase
MLGVGSADEDDLYAAMDWLLKRQGRIEKKLAARHLGNDSMVLYDLTSSYFEGVTCPLAALGHPRDRVSGKLQVNYGLMTDRRGRPVSVSVFKGNTSDTKTLLTQINKAKKNFGIERLVLVGDRGMITQTQIDELKNIEGIDWIGALRSEAIRKLVEDKSIQMGLFDKRNLFEIKHPDFPGERLVACRNLDLAKLRGEKRKALLSATQKELEKVRGMVQRGRLKGSDKIGVRVGKVIDKYKVAKHFVLNIADAAFEFEIDEKKVAAEAALDGLYVIRTSLEEDQLGVEEAVRSYKLLAQVERAFRSFKSIDLNVRPIRHRLEDRVRAHIFICMLAYYVQWHMIEAWRPLLYCDEDQSAKETRDPVAPAKRSKSALTKVHTGRLKSGAHVHSFRTLLQSLSALVRNKCRRKSASADEPTFDVNTIPNPEEQEAYNLLQKIIV